MVLYIGKNSFQINKKEGQKMKKFLSVMFAVIFVFSALSVCASAFSAKCPYCDKTFTSEAAYTEHMTTLNHVSGHTRHCPYTGDDYNGGGCKEEFDTIAGYEAHIANCPHKGDYTSAGTLKNEVLPLLVNAVKGVDWGGLLGSIVAIVKALVKGIDFGAVWNLIKSNVDFGSILSAIKGA